MGYNQGKNEMITNIMRNTQSKDVKFSANVAVVVKETTNTNNEVSTTFVEFPYLKDRTPQAVFKCVIIGILSDETINAELKERFASLENEDGKKCELKKGETYTPPTFTRLIANFAENYRIGYTDNEGNFHAVHTVTERANLRALLLVNGKKINEFATASSDTRRAIVHTKGCNFQHREGRKVFAKVHRHRKGARNGKGKGTRKRQEGRQARNGKSLNRTPPAHQKHPQLCGCFCFMRACVRVHVCVCTFACVCAKTKL